MPSPKLSITALMAAVLDCKLTAIRDSLRLYGLPNNCPKTNDYMILQRALTNRQKDIAKLLIEAGCRVRTENSDTGWSPLALAVIMQSTELVYLLVHKKATLAAGNGSTVLHLAAQRNSIKMLELLLGFNLNINCRDTAGKTPLQALLEDNSVSRTETEQKLYDSNRTETIKFLISRGASVDFKGPNGETVLYHAMKIKTKDVLLLFLDKLNDSYCNYNNDTALHVLLSDNVRNEEETLEIVKILIEQGLKADVCNKDQQTALHMAAKKKYFKILQVLIESQCNINVLNNQKETILHIMLRHIMNSRESIDKEKDFVELILSNGGRLDILNVRNVTPMTLAYDLRHKDILNLVLNYVKDINRCKIYNEYVLHYLAQNKSDVKGRVKVLKEFLDRGAWVDIPNELQQTPLQVACINRQKEIIEILIDNKANVNSKDKIQESILRSVVTKGEDSQLSQEIAGILLSKGAIVEDEKCGEISLLQYTSRKNHGKMLYLLLKHSKRVDYCDTVGNTILHNLVRNERDINDEKEKECAFIAKLMILKGVVIDAKNKLGLTALHVAAKNKHDKVIQALIAHKASATDFDEAGNNLLHFLGMKKLDVPKTLEKDMVQCFVSHGCNVDAKNVAGQTPLLVAAESGCARVARALMKYGADVNNPMEDTLERALHIAIKFNRASVVEQILIHGADVNVLTQDLKTPLHLAAECKGSSIIKLLLDHGADTEIQDKNGKTALHIACMNNNVQAVNYLLVYGADINVKNNVGATPLMLAANQNQVMRTKLLQYVIKLEAANLHVSPENFMFIEARRHELLAVTQQIKKEILDLEKISVDYQTSLADVLHMNSNKLWIYKNNVIIREVIERENFSKRFPHYKDLITACYHRGMVRNKLIGKAKFTLRCLTQSAIPDACCEKIFNFLNNGNLNCLIKAPGKGNVSKIRKSLEQAECNLPLKKSRASV